MLLTGLLFALLVLFSTNSIMKRIVEFMCIMVIFCFQASIAVYAAINATVLGSQSDSFGIFPDSSTWTSIFRMRFQKSMEFIDSSRSFRLDRCLSCSHGALELNVVWVVKGSLTGKWGSIRSTWRTYGQGCTKSMIYVSHQDWIKKIYSSAFFYQFKCSLPVVET